MPRPATDLRPRLIAAARRHFLDRGVDGASLRAIAQDAATSVGMIHYHFRTKDELFFAVVEEVYVVLLEDLRRALARDAPAPVRIRRVYLRLARASELELETIRLVMQEAPRSSARMGGIIDRFRQGHLPLVLALVADGMADGSLTDEHPPLVLMMSIVSMGVVPQLLRRALADVPELEDLPHGEALAERELALLFGGVAGKDRS